MSWDLVQELDSSQVGFNKDSRGLLCFFSGFELQDLHAGSLRPGAVRGEHTHDRAEVLCILRNTGHQTCYLLSFMC
ncbi:MAG: hypothetical protein ACLFRL_01685 [Desulfohalobiaceae bacterium]